MIERIYCSEVEKPKVSIIFLDWSCRESFHSLDYLTKQTVDRDQYEIIWVEYYSRQSEEISRRMEADKLDGKHSPLDQWIVMGMPEDLYYYKHLRENGGQKYLVSKKYEHRKNRELH